MEGVGGIGFAMVHCEFEFDENPMKIFLKSHEPIFLVKIQILNFMVFLKVIIHNIT